MNSGSPPDLRQIFLSGFAPKRLMAVLGHGDVVVIPAVDRLSRDATDLLVIARDMLRAGSGLRSIAEPVVDTTSDFAELVLASYAWRRREAGTPTHRRAHGTGPG
jgi:DNA invertase Pin-like site-specific DNA recombinase